MKFIIIPVTPFRQNSSLWICEETNFAISVDPGGDLHLIEEEIKKQSAILQKVCLTHGHLDHCADARILADRYQVPIVGPHQDDQFWLDLLPEQSARFGFGKASAFLPDCWLNDGDIVTFGNEILEIRHCPGHTPGHIIFYSQQHQLAAVGDVLFAGAIGRTDFPRGNHQQLITSITEKLWPLGNNVRFIPGHGRMSTFEIERQTNPYVADTITKLST